ncbi:MAG: TAT-variant-translocated molybdopterin oxidoreductase [Bacteroidetes bacterium]|nr:TAT-variant-translocated molybdopterin oxidoreductase [Bacteroidota bacterium]
MTETKKYWKGLEELTAAPQFVEQSQKEFAEHVPVDKFLSDSEATESKTHRRDFLKYLGFSVTAASLAACESPVTKAIPYLNKPEEITPGVANYYASTYFDGYDFAGVVVKTREGRPIHIKGNKHSLITGGAVNARVNSSVLELYDAKRGKAPAKKSAGAWKKGMEWSTVDKEISTQLASVSAANGKIVLLTGTLMSPSSEKAIAEFAAKFPGTEHVVYDSISSSGILKANSMMFGKSAVPAYHFDKAKVIVSLGADFLAGWLNSNQYAAQYGITRKPDGEWMSKHFQFETKMSLTGSNADVRATVKPSEQGIAAAYLLKAVGGSISVPAGLSADVKKKLDKAAAELKAAKGSSLVVAGSNNSGVQLLVNAINEQLGNYGSTLDIQNALNIRKGSDSDYSALVAKMAAGSVGAIIIAGVNPVYSSPAKIGKGGDFKSALAKVKVKIYLGDRLDETGAECDYICPDNHYLESWNDYNPAKGHYNIAQPAINKLFSTRQWQESILSWSGNSTSFRDYIQNNWSSEGLVSGAAAWNEAVQHGVYVGNAAPAVVVDDKAKVATPKTDEVDAAMATVAVGSVTSADLNKFASEFKTSSSWEIELYVKAGMGDGRHALNPWLQELPDPITKVTWDNYATMHPEDVKELFDIKGEGYEGFNELYLGEKYPAKVIKISANGTEIEVPVYPLPGQARKTVSLALGYGRSITSGIAREEWSGGMYKEGALIGVNAFPLISNEFEYSNAVTITATTATYPLATTQTHHTMMGRKIVNETTLAKFHKDGDKAKEEGGYNEQELLTDTYGKKRKPEELDLWEDQGVGLGHRWGMVIDLSTCIGCGACATACQSENNIPVVGKDEVRRSREMHWIRIDRYFSSTVNKEKVTELDQLNSIAEYHTAEVPDEEPQVVFQPVMCQHCNHAPCETVCPVAATTHSQEGLNQMAYNRCIGTRYCANNCPFKVRRFNWFQYDSLNLTQYPDFNKINPAHDDLGRMVLNPDVVVRSRGVIEKCSMCVQRIQHGKLEAKKAGHAVEDGSIETACAEACPTHAIQFGDLNDTNSYVSKASKEPRSYTMLDEVGVKPNVYYQTKVRNIEA